MRFVSCRRVRFQLAPSFWAGLTEPQRITLSGSFRAVFSAIGYQRHTSVESMPPRKSKAKSLEEDVVDQTPVRRSTRARRSVVQTDECDEQQEPPKKRPRNARAASASNSAIISNEGETNSESVKPLKSEERDAAARRSEQSNDEESKTPVKSPGRGRLRKVSEHKSTPHPKSLPASRGGRKRRELSETIDEDDGDGITADGETETSCAIKKSKIDVAEQLPPSPDLSPRVKASATNAISTVSPDVKRVIGSPEKKSDLEDEASVTAASDKSAIVGSGKAIRPKSKSSTAVSSGDCLNSVPKTESSNVTKTANGLSGRIKPASGTYEENIKIGGDLKVADLTVASLVGEDSISNVSSLRQLDNPDVVAIQKCTPAALNDAETCGFKVFGNGPTRLLVKTVGSKTQIEVKEPPETQSLILLAFNELDEVTSKSRKKCVEDYLTAHCAPTDEFSVFTLSINGKTATLVNVQLESQNRAVSSLLIGCLMRKLDSRPNAFILTGYMPYVRPGSPAYELLRDGYFGNHSIETLQKMRDIKMEDEEEPNKGLIDFFWKAYQHSRPWMRSAYETILDGESVPSGTGQAVIWHSTKGIEAIRVFNHTSIVKADLAIKSES